MNYTETWTNSPLQMIEVNTDDIITIPELAGRGEFKRNKDKMKELVASIQNEGQLQPATVGLNEDETLGALGVPVLFHGFGRYEACVAAKLPLLCQYSAKPLSEVLRMGMHANTKFEALSPVQIALNLKRLADEGMAQTAIAKAMGMSPANVSLYLRFFANGKDEAPLFSKKTLALIHEGKVSAGAAYDLVDLGTGAKIDTAVEKLLEKAKTKGAKSVSRADARNTVREEGDAPKTKKNGKKGKKQRSIKEVIAFLTEWDVAGVPDPVRKTVKATLWFATGEKTSEQVQPVLMKIAA